jgi:hypothetical protein
MQISLPVGPSLVFGSGQFLKNRRLLGVNPIFLQSQILSIIVERQGFYFNRSTEARIAALISRSQRPNTNIGEEDASGRKPESISG